MLLLCLGISELFGQSIPDTLEIRRASGIVFRQNGKDISRKQFLKLIEQDEAAKSEIQVARQNSDAANVFSFAGGFCVGYTVGKFIAGGKPDFLMAEIGAGLIVVSIPFSIAYYRHAKNAVEYYNEGLKRSLSSKPDFNLGLNTNGMGITVRF